MESFWRSLPGSWQEKLVVVLGVCLATSPWLLGYSTSNVATGNAVVIGMAFTIGEMIAILLDTSYASYAVAFLAFWLTLSARILGYDDHILATSAQIAFGVGGIVFALGGAFVRARRLNPPTGARIPPTAQPSAPEKPRRRTA